ncbi:MAG: nitroreductase family protein [Candidatus Geothermarchaeales archaeon]
MEVLESIKKRTTTREYLDKAISKDDLRDILEAGRVSPSAMNSQAWKFIVVDDKENLKKLASLTTSGPHIADSGLTIALTVRRGSWSRFDVGRAAQQMALVAWSRKIGSGMVGGWKEEAREFLSVPEGWELVGCMAFGYVKDGEKKGVKRRKPLEEVTAHRRFDQKLEL